MLGSRATDVRGGLGGFLGRALKKGDQLGRLPTEAPAKLACAAYDPLRSRTEKTSVWPELQSTSDSPRFPEVDGR